MSLIIPANTLASGGYEVANSCRFDDGSSTQMNKTISSTSTTWTFSCWIKQNPTNTNKYLVSWDMGSGESLGIGIEKTSSSTQLFIYTSSTGQAPKLYDGKLRDPSAWMNIVIKNSSGTITSYINGTQAKTSITGTALASGTLRIGCWTGSNFFYDGYMSEVVLIDGTAYSADSFGEFDEDSGIWKPKDVSSGLTFGSDGFYLDFKDSANLGNDANGGTDLTENNLTAVDQSTDTCTNNFCTMNALAKNQYVTLTNGNISSGINNANEWGAVSTTIAMNGGKWYCEAKVKDKNNQAVLGIYLASLDGGSQSALDSQRVVTNIKTGNIFVQGLWSYSEQTGLGGASNGDIYGIAFDSDNGSVQFYKNGSAYGSAVSNSVLQNETFMFATQLLDCGFDWNFGSPAFAISSGNQDPNGYGNFEYSTNGYYALNTKNLAEYG